MPKRIQRKRTKGWRMPESAVYVGRGSIWGNPFKFKNPEEAGYTRHGAVVAFQDWLFGNPWACPHSNPMEKNRQSILDNLPLLKGKDLACWCPLDQPCHADVLLELANKDE